MWARFILDEANRGARFKRQIVEVTNVVSFNSASIPLSKAMWQEAEFFTYRR